MYKFDKQQQYIVHKAYVGEPQITTPDKKPKKGDLTDEQKEANKQLSSIKIYIKYII